MTRTNTLAKLATPVLSGVYSRNRLFTLLDSCRLQPIVWIHAPAGYGKTTLAASYLRDRNHDCLWYQMDSGDRDIASFFYYLGQAGKQAAPKCQKPLPLLTPEYMGDLTVFVRNYFRTLFECMGAPKTLVVDNYQEVPGDAVLHTLLANALQEVPQDYNIFIISRNEPPAAYARLLANRSLSVLNPQDLAFTLEETRALVELFGYQSLADDIVEEMHGQFNGWCAGMILQMQQGIDRTLAALEKLSTPATVFDYLGIEVFSRFSEEEQDVLLKSALLPQMSHDDLQALTGNANSGSILAQLNCQNYFTTLFSNAPPVYQFHALFREFLLKQGERLFAPTQWRTMQIQAAELLEANSKYEDAAELFWCAEAYDSLFALILKFAPLLVEQGRFQQLQGLIDKLPRQFDENPWTQYWQATALLPIDFDRSRKCYEQALAGFELAGQREGMFLSWTGIVDTIVMAWDDFEPLSRWTAWMDAQMASDPVFPNPMVEARVTFGMFCSLMYHQPQHPDITLWVQRIEGLLDNLPDADRRIMIASNYVLYLAWLGDFDKAGIVLERVRPVATADKASPLNLIGWQQAEAVYHWVIGKSTASDAFLQTGLDLAQHHGIHLIDFILLVQRFYTRLETATPEEREGCLRDVRLIMDQSGKARQSHYYYIAALDAVLRHDPQRALAHLDKAEDLLTGLGLPVPYALYGIAKARTLTELGRFDEARENLVQAGQIVHGMASRMLEFSMYMAEAELAFAQFDEANGVDALTRALVLGKAKRYLHIDWWRPHIMLFLFLKALEHGIEVDYVQWFIRQRNLQPDRPPLHLDNWPWQIKIYTLGRFSILLDDAPIHMNAKGQKKPLELLKALIAFGGRSVSESKLTEALWPEADGDVAHSSFTTTLSRLRKLLCRDALIVQDGQLSLNDRVCWLDTWAYQRLLAKVAQLVPSGAKSIDLLQRSMDKAIALYKGAFMAKQSQMGWTLGARERLRLKMLRAIKAVIDLYGRQGLCQKAIGLYEKALELDPVEEEYYRSLMKCHAGLGDRAKALAVYGNCRDLLWNTFQIEASIKTQQIYQTIRDCSPSQLTRLCDPCRRAGDKNK